jgi:hypothetical protein
VNLGKSLCAPVTAATAVEFAGSLSSHESKALKHGHYRVITLSIGADRGDDGIWIYALTGSFITLNNLNQIASTWLHRSRIGFSTTVDL